MITPLPIRVTHRAAGEIRDAALWWSKNRPAARGAVMQELKHAFDLISHQPEIGTQATNPALEIVRRVYLSRVRYYVYYRVNPSRLGIDVLAFWHASRGVNPDL